MIDKSKIPELNQALREINIELKKVRLKFNDLLEKRREKLIKKKEIIVNKIKTRENQVIKSPTNSKTLIREDPLWKNYDEIKKKIERMLRRSVEYAFEHRESSLEFVVVMIVLYFFIFYVLF